MRSIFSKGNRIVIIDWQNFVHRAFHVVEARSKKSDDSGLSNPLELLIYMIEKLRRSYPGSKIIVAIEGRGTQNRKRILTDYKANRRANGDVKKVYTDSLDLLRFVDCTVIKAPAGEADDAIATYLSKHVEKNDRAIIVSEDRDLWQMIVGDRITVLTQRGQINAYECKKILGVPPSKVACFKSMAGDKSDNVQRAVPRMRTKSIEKFANLGKTPELAYKRAKLCGALSDKELSRIIENKDKIKKNFAVVKLRKSLPLEKRSGKADAVRLEAKLNAFGCSVPLDVLKLAIR